MDTVFWLLWLLGTIVAAVVGVWGAALAHKFRTKQKPSDSPIALLGRMAELEADVGNLAELIVRQERRRGKREKDLAKQLGRENESEPEPVLDKGTILSRFRERKGRR